MIKKALQFIAALLILAGAGMLGYSATTMVVNALNISQFGGTSVTLGSKTSASSMPVVIASDQGAVPVSGTFWQATQPVSFGAGSFIVVGGSVTTVGVPLARNIPVQSSATCTTSDFMFISSNTNRAGLECEADVGNTDRVFRAWGQAATNAFPRIESGAGWQPPVVSTVSVHCLANSGSQIIRCTEYSSQ